MSIVNSQHKQFNISFFIYLFLFINSTGLKNNKENGNKNNILSKSIKKKKIVDLVKNYLTDSYIYI